MLKATKMLPMSGGDARKRRVWGIFDETKDDLVGTDDVQQCCVGGDTRQWLSGFVVVELEVRESGAVRKWKLIIAGRMKCWCDRERVERGREEVEKSKLIWELDFKRRKKEKEELVGKLLKKFQGQDGHFIWINGVI